MVAHKARKDYSDKTPKVPKKVAWIRIQRGARVSLMGGYNSGKRK